MENKVNLPEDQWVQFRDTEEVTNRQRIPFMRAINKMQLADDATGDVDFMLEWTLSTAYMVLADWSWELAIPKDYRDFRELFEDLPAWQYDLVTNAAVDYVNGTVDEEADVVDVELPEEEFPELPKGEEPPGS